jgi:hypothetical protein
MPKRVQRKRVKGQPGIPAGAKYCGRPSKWGNPFKVGEPFRYVSPTHGVRMGVIANERHAASEFGLYLAARTDLHQEIRRELGGLDLACWCPLGQACHVDHLLTVANSPAPVSQEGGNQ